MNATQIINNIRQATNAQLIAVQDELQEMRRIKRNCQRDLLVVKKAIRKVLAERERRAYSA